MKPRHYIFITLGIVGAWIAISLAMSGPRDFMACYAAGSLLLRHPYHLYSMTAQLAGERAAGIGEVSFLPWAHPAAEALLYAPLTLMSYSHAFAVWSAISIGMFLLSVWLLREEILGLPPAGRYSLLVFSLFPVLDGLYVGQEHTLFLLLWALAYRKWKAGDDFASGLWIGLSLIRYQFVVPMLLFFVVMKAWKLMRGLAVAGFAMVAASFLLVGPGLVPTYLHTLRYLARVNDGNASICMPTLRGLAGGFLPSHGDLVAALCLVCLLAWALTTVRRMDRSNAFCFAMVVSLLADPHAYLYELTILSIPFALFLRKRPNSGLLAFILAALTFACFIAHLLIFSILCPVLLAWAIWMARVFRQGPAYTAAGPAFSAAALLPGLRSPAACEPPPCAHSNSLSPDLAPSPQPLIDSVPTPPQR